ncbi:MAG: hypothetical protein ACE5I4_02965 [Thermoplasmata archaeon]
MVLCLLLTSLAVPFLADLAPTAHFAGGAEQEEQPAQCVAFGINWTACESADVSDDVYATADPAGVGFVRAGGVFGTSFSFDIGSPGTDRLVVVLADDESSGTSLTDVTVDSNSCSLVTEADNPSGAGNHQEMWYCDEDDLGASGGLVTVAIVGGGFGWAVHAHLYTGASQTGPADIEIEDAAVGTTTIEVEFVTVPAGGLVVFGAAHGSSGSFTGWTSPLLERMDGPDPSSAVMASASETESAAQTDKTYIATASSSFNRGTGIVAVWPSMPGRNDTAWLNFGLSLGPQDTVNRVEVGVEWHRLTVSPILNVTLSWDGGSTWAVNQTATNKSADDDILEYLNFTAATAWDPMRLSDANLRVRVGTNHSGARLDYLTVRVNYNGAPRMSDFRLEAGSGMSRAGEQLEVGIQYHFLFNVTDEDGWSDIGVDGSVSLRLWYDGNVTPELAYGAQTNGSRFRVEFRYLDTSDPGNASTAEWGLVEGDASYNAAASDATAILSGSLVVGFAFDLAFSLGSQIGASTDPTNTTPGAYNDPDSWNVEIVSTDAAAVVTHQAAASGAHMEFGVYPPLLDLALVSSSGTADPGDVLTLNATVENFGPGLVQNLLLEATVDLNGTYLASAPTGAYDSGTRVLSWTVSLLTPGQQASVEWTVRVAPGTPDLASVNTSFRVAYEDASGSPQPPLLDSTETIVEVPGISPVLRFDRTGAEAGDVVLAILYFNNTGSGLALRAWANWSLDGHYELMDVFPAQATTPSAEGFDILLTDIDPGPHSIVVRLRVVRGLEDGLNMAVRVAWSLTDGNGNPLPGVEVSGSVTLFAPTFTIDLRASDTSVQVGSEFILDITVRNGGRAEGSGWLNMTLPPGAAYVGQNGTLEVTTSAGLVSWRIASLAAAEEVRVQVRLRVNDGPSLESFVLSLDFTDGAGSPPLTVFSNQVFVRFVGSGGIALPWWIFLLPLLVPVVFAGFYLYRRLRHPELRIEEVFVIHRKGILVAHQSRTLTPDKDRDILAAMFKAVQGFVQEAFARGTEGSMRGLRFENFNILIEQGTYHYVAVVYRGQESRRLARRVATLSQAIETEFGALLAAWVGDMEEIRGIRRLLPLIWGESAGFGAREAPQPTLQVHTPLAPAPKVEFRSIPGKLFEWLPLPFRGGRRALQMVSFIMRALVLSRQQVLTRLVDLMRRGLAKTVDFVRGGRGSQLPVHLS